MTKWCWIAFTSAEEKLPLQKETAEPGLYVAQFKIPSPDAKRDIIMHVDPKKEYGNKPPVIPEEMPFKLEER